jgi:diguanylate cyclase (GGDEF)-like protein/PAS domain S-box-containing protein
MFPLLKHFSVTSLIAVVATTLLLGTLHDQVERTQLLDLGESNHVALTHTFANSLLPKYRQLSATAKPLETEALRVHPMIAEMRQAVIGTMRNTRVVKVKLYDLDGRTIFSTDPTQIGKNYKDNAGFVSAAKGQPSSELTHRERFSAFDKEIAHRDLLSSYVALQTEHDAPVEGVLEVYSDVTDWVQHIDQQAKLLTFATVISLCLLYGVLYIIVRRADKLIRAQYEKLQESEAELRIAAKVFESQLPLLVTDADSVIVRVNEAFAECAGYSAEELIGQKPSILKSDQHDEAFYRAMWQSIEQTSAWQGEIWDRRKNGEIYPKLLTISAVKNEFGKITHYVGTHVDITARKKADEQIKTLAFYDGLTGLPNRSLLFERLQHTLSLSLRSKQKLALMFIDMDHFKQVNDTLGHAAGDVLLKEVARRLQVCVRQSDTVSRWGGDEFIIMLENLDTDADEARTLLTEVGKKILAEFARPFVIEGQPYHYTASVGATLFGESSCTVDELLKQADEAMYLAKENGRNAFILFG